MTARQRVQLRRDTAAAWTAANPVLLEGEAGIETDTRLLKIGDGSTEWSDLPYFVSGSATILENEQAIAENYVISTGKNGLSAGPVEVEASYTVTVPAGAVWAIV